MSDHPSMQPSSRERKLTENGSELYDQQVTQQTRKLQKLKGNIELIIFAVDFDNLPEEHELLELQEDVINRFTIFEQLSSSFISFLQGTRTPESKQEEAGHVFIAQSLKSKVDSFLSSIQKHLHEHDENTTIIKVEKSNSAKATSQKHIPVLSAKDEQLSQKTFSKRHVKSEPQPSTYKSAKTRRTSKTLSSHASEMLLKEQVKLESAKIKLKYTEKEQELTLRKAALNADIEKLERERDVEEAESKVRVLQEAVQFSDMESSVDNSSVNEDFVMDRTRQFVMQDAFRLKDNEKVLETNIDNRKHDNVKVHNVIHTVAEVHTPIEEANINRQCDRIQNTPKTDRFVNTLKSDRNNNTPKSDRFNEIKLEKTINASISIEPESGINAQPDQIRTTHRDINCENAISSKVRSNDASFPEEHFDERLKVNAPVFIPPEASYHSPTERTKQDNQKDRETNLCDEFSRFMVRKELVFSRLTKYDDEPDMYLSWKCTFENVVKELNLSHAEEVDLLVKWLGPTSSKQALRIRSANTSDPKKCRDRIWERLEDRFGRPEMVEDTIKRKIASFPRMNNRDYRPLFDLSDIVEEINGILDNERYQSVFAQFNSSSGVNQIVTKLPYNIQEKWTHEANQYKTQHKVLYPPFSFFASFISRMAKLRNDPSFKYDYSGDSSVQQRPRKTGPVHVSTKITGSKDNGERIDSSSSQTQNIRNVENSCPIHEGSKHSLNMCRAFRTKPISERKEILKKNGICFRCCGPRKHLSKTCTETIKCTVCKSNRHPSALHVDYQKESETYKPHEGETNVNNSCTQICGSQPGTSMSCAKIIMVNVFHKDNPENVRQVYCLIDDQSNRSLATGKFFKDFQEHGHDSEYVLSTCSGQFTTSGRRARNYVVQSIDQENSLLIPEIIECNEIPNNRHEIPSREIVEKFDHLKDIARFIEPIRPDVSIELLIGRDLISAHHVLDHRMGDDGLPYAQRLRLGWVVLGETCLGKVHRPDVVRVYKTQILLNGRPTTFQPCEYNLRLKSEDDRNDNVFRKTPFDENIGLSVEDRDFLEIMDSKFEKDQNGQWSAPLPFQHDRTTLRSNRSVALKRARSFDYSLSKDEKKAKHVIDFMQKMIDNDHAEKAPDLKSGEEHWYLPVFGVYHPRKPDNIRLVFDSSAKFENQSLNDSLLKGPDLTNKLLGILLNFRKEKIAITCDVEQMFYNFKVHEDHRNFLRFLWHEQNDLSKPLTDFRMTVHVFGNRPSPAIATYGFRKTVENEAQDIRDFVNNHFYVDDGLISCQNVNEAASLVKRTQLSLWEGGKIRLHKITSNSTDLLEQFDTSDLSKGLNDLDLSSDELPTQRSLGVSWNVGTDEITFQISPEVKPFTRRGALSTINSIYDPVGFAAPVIIRGKLLLREMMKSDVHDWDDVLSESYLDQWESWVTSLKGLESLRIPRMYTTISFASATLREIHIFSDASKEAIAAVAYLKLSDGMSTEVSFVMGKAKVAPSTGHTIPRLELCGAVLAVEMSDSIKEHLEIETENIYFYTDSQVVLGYISNTSRRFYVYVCNRVSRIRASSDPSHWRYVSSETNPADLATRSVPASSLQNTSWFHRPTFLRNDNESVLTIADYDLVDPEKDQEIRPDVQILVTTSSESKPFEPVSNRFDKFSEWRRLILSINCLRNRILTQQLKESKNSVNQLLDTERFVIKEVQGEAFQRDIDSLHECENLPRNSSIISLNPILDSKGILSIGGRLQQSDLSDSMKHPIIIPKGHIATLLIRHFHSKIAHQGRSFTEAAIRNAGYWIIGAKRLINSIIRKCVVCKKLRGKVCTQQMAELPADRVTPSPPFSYVGVDVFGPWQVAARRTRGGVAQAKRWAILFACLVTRAIHLEVIEEMSSSSFINAWRRFIAIRGQVRQVRSDRGTNFVGATQDLSMLAHFVEDRNVRKFLNDNRITWEFNPPHASHFGGAWERLIGVSRRILDSLLLENRFKDLTHEMLITFLAEVMAIVNNRPLTSVSYDSDSPSFITPSILLTQKTDVDHEIAPFPDFNKKDAIRHHWKHVQYLAQQFWTKWQNEYLHILQVRQKWHNDEPNVKVGTVVLMKDSDCARNYWPTGIVQRVFPSDDGKVRKVELRVIRDGQTVVYVRPISQIVVLVDPE